MVESTALKRMELVILPNAYEMSCDGQKLARLEGGSAPLLADAGARLRDVDIETAIQHAEDWLMPFSKRIRGLELRVRDSRGRVREHFGGHASLTLDDVERAFSRVVDGVAFQRVIDREFVADLVLLRELMHHGALPRIVLEQTPAAA